MSAQSIHDDLESYNARLYTLRDLVDEESGLVDFTSILNDCLSEGPDELTDPPTIPHSPTASDGHRGRSQERQYSPEVYTYSKRAASHSPDSLLYHGDESPFPDDTPRELFLPIHNAYEYRPLSATDIRLLRISPGAPDDDLHCALKHIPLSSIKDNVLEFQALSYAWGEKSPRHIIYVHDVLGEEARPHSPLPRRLRIRSNLYWALQQIREIHLDTWLWVDALCINQVDEDEKSEQIPNMPDIYSNAWNVVVWLGEASYHGYGTRSITKLLPQILNLRALDTMLKSEQVDTHIPHSMSELCALLSRPWFNRRWVIQEIACARRLSVRFGSNVLSWVDFTDAIELILDHLDLLRDACVPPGSSSARQYPLQAINVAGLKSLLHLSRHVFRKTYDGKISSRLMNLESLVVAASSFDVTEPQDIIYSLLHLATDVSSDDSSTMARTSSFVADYSRTNIETFFDFINHCINTQASLDILLRPWLNYPSQRKRHLSIPTWMEFCVPRVMQMDSFVGPFKERTYNASQGTTIAAYLERCITGSTTSLNSQSINDSIMAGYSGKLVVSGVVVGQIKRIAISSPGLISDQCLRLLGWQGTLADGVPDQLWRTLVADRTNDYKPAPAWYRRACALALTHLDEDGNLDYTRLTESVAQPDTLMRYINRVRSVVEGRSFFTCEASGAGRDEIVGLVSTRGGSPGDIRTGDYICILFGCSVPVVLRGNLESSKVVRLFGDAYVHGHMEGEFFGCKTAEEIAQMTVQFKIR